MAMAFPAGLPAPAIEGHAISAGQDAIRTEMETGAARTRRRSFSSPDRVSLAWYFSAQEFAIFRAWWDGEIHGGSAWFDFLIDDGITGVQSLREVRFVESFEASLIAYSQWRVTVKAEIRRQRLSAFDHLNTLGLPSLDLDFSGTKSLSPVITSARQPAPAITFTRASTATYVGADGLIKTAAIAAPRFDHDPVTLACKGLLMEEARTNLLLQSAGVDTNTGWALGSNLTRVGKAAAPDGSTDATTYTTTSTGNAFARQTVALAANTSYTLSVYARLRSGSVPSAGALLVVDYDSNNNASNLDRVTLGWTGLSSSWQRFALTFSNVAALAATSVYICTDFGNGAQIDIWGAQLEAGSFATSYIRTTSAAVARSADSAVINASAFSTFWNAIAGTVVASFRQVGVVPSGQYRGIWAAGWGAEGRITLAVGPGNDLYTYIDKPVGGTVQVSMRGQFTLTAGASCKVASAYALNDVAQSINGGAVITDTSAQLPAPSSFRFGAIGASGPSANCHIARLTYYPKRLTNAHLQALTV